MLQMYNEKSMQFIKRITEMSGLGDKTFLPEGMQQLDEYSTMMHARLCMM